MVKGNEIQKALGKTVRELRLANNLSQEKLAELASLDRSYISEVENGNKTASIITVFKIAVALDIKPSQLLQKMEEYFEFN
ncbi:helix-turn-helix transcriptional regulator [Aliifodinibius salicampi]|uniref:Helix-turn-helix transcriptional regulator n=1 Tax=Fodinibius salicampi TaxID=1920655 RepID=A0ABT3PXV2_9BACT|nr:helix-turn-helix transcriptional regulator [Fodinibius salicampi]MCW9712668.1 helix-turn-helix transcriptional regulator [Fodinibius salicampi]